MSDVDSRQLEALAESLLLPLFAAAALAGLLANGEIDRALAHKQAFAFAERMIAEMKLRTG